MQFLKSLVETLIIYFKIIFTNKKIILGPFHGEFGFEVSMNVSVGFSIYRKFKNELIVVSLEGNQALYKYCNQFISFNYDLKEAGYGYGKIEDSLILRKNFIDQNNHYANCIFIDLSRINIYFFKRLIDFSFVNLSDIPYNSKSNEISIHFRSVIKVGFDLRSNFTSENADNLVRELTLEGYKINIIGHPKFSYCPQNNCIDCRSNDINSALEIIQKSLITIGQLSGPIHLAHLCARPVITWADSIERFETVKMWNPHNQICIIVSENTFNPSVISILKKLSEFKNK
jgi:hypothetical protein